MLEEKLTEVGKEEREACAVAMEEMAMKYQEIVRWALNKGAQIIRRRSEIYQSICGDDERAALTEDSNAQD